MNRPFLYASTLLVDCRLHYNGQWCSVLHTDHLTAAYSRLHVKLPYTHACLGSNIVPPIDDASCMVRKGWSRSAASPTIMSPMLPNCRAATQLLAAVRPLKRPLYLGPSPANVFPTRVAIRGLSADLGEPISRKAWRYRNDPIYRERILATQRSAYRENSGFRERQSARMSLRYHTDDEYRLKMLDRKRGRLSSDPAWAEQHRDMEAIRSMVTKQVLSSPDIEWASHVPMYHKERKQEVFCSGCNRSKLLNLFWKRKAEPEKFDCHPCFASDPDRKWPIDYVKGRGCSTARDKIPVANHAHTSAAYPSPGPFNAPRRTTTITMPSSHRYFSTSPSLAGLRLDKTILAKERAKKDARNAYQRKWRAKNLERI